MKPVWRLLIIILLQLTANNVFAKHIIGGEMYYEYLGVDAASGHLKYRIVLKVYRDGADPTAAYLDPSIAITIFRQDNDAIVDNIVNIKLDHIDDIDYTLVDNCLGFQNLKYQIGYYYTDVIILPETQYGYYAAHQRCCRKVGITNLNRSDDLGATYSTSIPGTSRIASAPRNSSPQFVNRDSVIVCQNSFFSFDFSANDPDKDSLVYYFSDGFNGGGK
eukprot:gene41989-56853_t